MEGWLDLLLQPTLKVVSSRYTFLLLAHILIVSSIWKVFSFYDNDHSFTISDYFLYNKW